MTAPSRCTQRPFAIPASQNTAPVAEFRCLFTHDIRRKQKRWQDGYLKFHTFNNRVMVYDQARNYVADTYYQDSNELHEGDELNLEKGTMVEVAEAMGVTQTDLTPLFEKRPKESPLRPSIPPQAPPFHKPTPDTPRNFVRPTPQLRHKSLNTLLGSSKGPIGKAVPMQSPFEVRKEKENEPAAEPPAKRQKTNPQSASWKASHEVQEEAHVAKRAPSLPTKVSGSKTVPRPARFIPPAAEIVILEPDSDHAAPTCSDVTLPDTPPRALQSMTETTAKSPAHKKSFAQTPRLPRGKIPLPSKRVVETPKQLAPGSSPPVSVSNWLINVDFAVPPAKQRRKEPSPVPSPPRNRKVKSLRLSTGVKRGKLLCQSLPQEVPREGRKVKIPNAKPRSKDRVSHRAPSPAVVHDDDFHSQDIEFAAVRRSALSESQQKGRKSNKESASKRTRRSVLLSPVSSVSLDLFDDPEVVHGMLDQQLLVPSSPLLPPQLSAVSYSPPPEDLEPKSSTIAKPRATTHISRKRSSPESPTLEVSKSRSASPKRIKRTMQEAKSHKQIVDDPPPIRRPSKSPALMMEDSRHPRPNMSRAHSPVSEIPSRTPSISPTKKALSTGGFLKKRSAVTKLRAEAPTLAQAPRNETVPLPPHPLRADKKGPVMTTTELAAVLKKQKKSSNVTGETIEDQASGSKNSLNRNSRRVRSENDAPIPSTAEDWEKKNLPRTSSTLEDDIIQPLIDKLATTTARATNSTASTTTKKSTGLSALIKRTDPQRKLNRTQSLVVETNVPPIRDAETVSPPVVPLDTDVGPWSTEAFDLMDWRPPAKR